MKLAFLPSTKQSHILKASRRGFIPLSPMDGTEILFDNKINHKLEFCRDGKIEKGGGVTASSLYTPFRKCSSLNTSEV